MSKIRNLQIIFRYVIRSNKKIKNREVFCTAEETYIKLSIAVNSQVNGAYVFLRPAEELTRRLDMKRPKIQLIILAVAGMAILLSGCDLGQHRRETVKMRCEQKMAQARLTAAQELLAAGYTEQAQQILKPFLTTEITADLLFIAAEDEGDEDTPSQYAKVMLPEDFEAESQTY